MTTKRRTAVLLAAIAAMGAVLLARPARTAEEPQGEVALGAACLVKSTDSLAGALQKLPDKFAKDVQNTPIEGMGQYAQRVMGDYGALRPAIEVTIAQSMLLAADRVATAGGADGVALLKQRLQQAFGATEEEINGLHGEKTPWSEVTLALALAKATDTRAGDLMAKAKAKEPKSWPDIAIEAGLKQDKLAEALKEVFKQ